MDREQARIMALGALGWLAADDGLFAAFLTSSGTDAQAVRDAADTPALLTSILDFIMQSDEWVLACAGALGVAPTELVMVRSVLGGRDRMHWT